MEPTQVNPAGFADDGGPAFPCKQTTEHRVPMLDENNEAVDVPVVIEHCGLSLRDVFAGLSISGLLISDAGRWASYEEVAKHSYRLADAMLAAKRSPER